MVKIVEVLKNQSEEESSQASIKSGIREIAKTLSVVTAQSNSSHTTIKAREDGIAANTKKLNTKEELALKYFGLIDERLAKLERLQQENIVPVQHNSQEAVDDDQITMEASIPPAQPEAEDNTPAILELEDSTDLSSFQKTEFNNSTAATESQSEKLSQDDNHVCRVHNSVNASSIPSTEALFEVFDFKFEGNLTLTEICHINGTQRSNCHWYAPFDRTKLTVTLSSYTQIGLRKYTLEKGVLVM